MFGHKREGRVLGFSGVAGFHRDTQCKSFKRLICRECQNVPDCCQKLVTKAVKALGAHLLTNPPVGEMGHGLLAPASRSGLFLRLKRIPCPSLRRLAVGTSGSTLWAGTEQKSACEAAAR